MRRAALIEFRVPVLLFRILFASTDAPHAFGNIKSIDRIHGTRQSLPEVSDWTASPTSGIILAPGHASTTLNYVPYKRRAHLTSLEQLSSVGRLAPAAEDSDEQGRPTPGDFVTRCAWSRASDPAGTVDVAVKVASASANFYIGSDDASHHQASYAWESIMTVLLTNGTVLVDETLRAQAFELVQQAHDRSFRGIKLVTDDGSEVELSADLGAFVGHVLEGLARGPVSVTTLPEELTTTVAAELVGVSRPTLMKMVRNGELSAKKVGSHTRLSTTGVLALRKTRSRDRRAAFAALRAFDDEFGED